MLITVPKWNIVVLMTSEGLERTSLLGSTFVQP